MGTRSRAGWPRSRPVERIVYAAPERLRQAGFLELLRDAGIGLVVVDEAHCVSMWGTTSAPTTSSSGTPWRPSASRRSSG